MEESQKTCVIQACSQLVIRFANLIDAMRYEELVEMFTEQGSFTRPTEPDKVISGRKAILEAFQARPKDVVTCHLISNIEIDVLSPDEAVGRCYILLYTANAANKAEKFGLQASPGQFIGEFDDTFVREEDAWRFDKRRGKVLFTV